MRLAVAQRLPVYILDLNQPLLDRMMSAPHTIEPDALQKSTDSKARWKIVGGKVEFGSGANRMELYPLRGASTERQYMVYFPERKLLYASDTLALNDDGTLYDPELMYERGLRRRGEARKSHRRYRLCHAPGPDGVGEGDGADREIAAFLTGGQR